MIEYVPFDIITFNTIKKENERLVQLLLDKQKEIEYLEHRIITLEGDKQHAQTNPEQEYKPIPITQTFTTPTSSAHYNRTASLGFYNR